MSHQLLIVSLLALIAGCGQHPPRGRVEGTLTRRGQPLGDVMVTFVAEQGPAGKSTRASGLTDDQGRYQLRADDNLEGIMPGQYRVTLHDNAIASAPRAADGTILKWPRLRFPPRLGDPTQSPLRQKVVAGMQKIDVTVDQDR